MNSNANPKSQLVSIVIPTYNRAEEVSNCLNSVLNSSHQNLDVVVVDDASSDNTYELLTNKYKDDKRIRVHRNPTNLLPAVTRNVGLSMAHGEYTLFLDSDNIVEPDLITKLLEIFADPSVGLATALSIQSTNNTIWTLGASINLLTSRPCNLHEGSSFNEIGATGLYPTIYSPNLFMVPTKLARQIGGFDEGYGFIYEETDFGYKIAKAGYKGVICADVTTLHVGHLTEKEAGKLRALGVESPRRTYCFARNRTKFMRRWAPWWGLISYHLFFLPLFTLYYTYTALKNRRPDIAKAYIAGSFAGLIGIYKTKLYEAG